MKKSILCAIYPKGGEAESDISLKELERLADTAGCTVEALVTQCRERPDVKTVLGSGKIEELSVLCSSLEAELVVFDRELSPSQIKSIEDAIGGGVPVIDRSMLILDIFAAHARTGEGRLQVEDRRPRHRDLRFCGRACGAALYAAEPALG